jgi:hypothetical protein
MATDEPDDTLAPTHDASRPHLRLHHFFALTAVAAVILALMGPVFAQWSESDNRLPQALVVASMAWSLMYMFCIAVAATAVAYGVIWRRQGIPFFNQPGHWLLFEIGVLGVLSFVPSVFIFRLVQSEGNSYSFSAYQAYQIASFAFVATQVVVNIYIAWKKCREKRWRAVFLVKAVPAVSQIVRPIPIGAIVVMTALVFAVIGDRRSGAERDVSHWCGVWLEFATCVLGIGSSALAALHMHYMQ